MRDRPSARTEVSYNLAGVRKALCLAMFVTLTAVGPTGEATGTTSQVRPRATNYGRLPFHFEPNQGQTDGRVKFLSRGIGYGLFLTSTESVLILQNAEAGRPREGLAATQQRSRPPVVLKMRLLEANPRPLIAGKEPLRGQSHYFNGSDPRKWRTHVPQYARVEYRDVYPGVSLTYYGNQGELEYDFVVSPGGDPRRIRFGIEGAESIRVDGEGNLVLALAGGEVVEKAPVVYQEVGGARKPVAGRFVLRGPREVGFELGVYEVNRRLVLDPVVVYSTYLGGSGVDTAYALAVDASGNPYIAGTTTSTNFPTANPLQAANAGGNDAFVAKLNGAGSTLVYSTYLGGSNFDQALGIAVDGAGSAYVTGWTRSTNFPTVNAIQAIFGGGNASAFVAKVNPTGSALDYSTYLGGSLAGPSGGVSDVGNGIAVDASGNAYVTGFTTSTNFPTVNPIQGTLRGGANAFVAKLNAAGSALVYSTYLGGTSSDNGNGIAVDTSGNAYITGFASSNDFPTKNPIQATLLGAEDAVVAKLNAAGSALVYSTFLGGSGNDIGNGIAVDTSGNAYVTGYTSSTDFPTVNPVQAANGGNDDAFIVKLNAAGSALVYSTYLGGSSLDQGLGIAVDASGNAYIVGTTLSANFPTANPFQVTYGLNQDAFVAKLSAAGPTLVYSTYFGGTNADAGRGIAVDTRGNAYITGNTGSFNFPTVNPLQATYGGGGSNAFVAKIDLQPRFFTVTPCRVLDTRNPVGPSGGPALGANTTRSFPVTGLCGIPSTAIAVALNVTTVDETDFGDLRTYPNGNPVPSSSTINFAVQKVRANNAVIPLGLGGRIAVQCDMPPTSTGQTNLVIDVTGYFQ